MSRIPDKTEHFTEDALDRRERLLNEAAARKEAKALEMRLLQETVDWLNDGRNVVYVKP